MLDNIILFFSQISIGLLSGDQGEDNALFRHGDVRWNGCFNGGGEESCSFFADKKTT